MGITRYFIALACIPHVLQADGLALSCQGLAPDWSLELRPDSADFAYFDRESSLEIPQQSNAEGVEWPKALTLVGPRDSAILIVHKRNCGSQTHEAQVLTQRGETPVLLTACCSVQP